MMREPIETMRDRKYRAWHKKEKKMYYFNWDTLTCTKYPGYYNPIDKSKACELSDKSLYSEPMDFIGLKDKNGEEIYERDHVRNKYGFVYEVIWGSCGFDLMPIYSPLPSLELTEDQAWRILEIVGDYLHPYENPELVEAKE